MVNIWPIIDQLIGARCPLCNGPGDGLCAACRETLPRNSPSCRRCALPLAAATPGGTLCADCQRRPPPFARVIAPLRYEPPVDDLVAAFKYHARLSDGRLLAGLLGDVLRQRTAPLPALLLPVPMHARGLRERGFNQAAELARVLAEQLGLAWSTGALRRVRDADHQRGLDRRQRRRNLRGAFACTATLPAHVAVVDDVVTTAATVDEISRVLRAAGVADIEVWAVARTPRV
ncbi:MAG: double zinc ribbon domain-containing protein [Gammaproteobacteria bacterium]|nr:double zinc ribbon domain-containing protein [Gammaproteobacteria bacterium]